MDLKDKFPPKNEGSRVPEIPNLFAKTCFTLLMHGWTHSAASVVVENAAMFAVKLQNCFLDVQTSPNFPSAQG